MAPSFTYRDLVRAIRAAQKTGASRVLVRRDGTIVIELDGPAGGLISPLDREAERQRIVAMLE